MSITISDLFSPGRYWTDRPIFMPQLDAVDAELDREDCLSERNAFLLGRDLGRFRLDQPKDSEAVVHWPHPEMQRGYAYGLEMQASRCDVYSRKLLGLRVRAFARGIPVSSAITVDFLRSITATVCPVSGVKLTLGTLSGTDWSVARLDNSLGYVPGNVCMLSTRVNSLKGDSSFRSLAEQGRSVLLRRGPDGFAEELPNGLLVLEGLRLAALMAAPSAFACGQLATYGPFAMAPRTWASIDSVVAGIHLECARSQIEGAAYARRKTLFKRLGTQAWRASNRLVRVASVELNRGTHPADIWFDGESLALLSELMDRLMSSPPQSKFVDPEAFAQAMRAGIQPIAQYVRWC